MYFSLIKLNKWQQQIKGFFFLSWHTTKKKKKIKEGREGEIAVIQAAI